MGFLTNYTELLVFVVAFAAAWLINSILFRLIRFKAQDSLRTYSLRQLKRPVFLLLTFLLFQPAFTYVELDPVIIGHINRIFLIIIIAWFVIAAIRIGAAIILSRYDIDTSDNLSARKSHTQIRILRRVTEIVVMIIALGVGLTTFEGIRSIGTSILTSAGIVGITIGLGAQRIIGNILAGLQLAFTQPIRLDDVVIVEGEWGKIEEITLSYVVVAIWDERRLIVPSNYFIEKPFQNWTRTSAQLLGTVFIYTDYRFSIDELRKELSRILADTELWDGRVNVIQVTNLNDKTMELRALISAKNSGSAWDLRVHVREKLIEFIKEKHPEALPKSRIELEPDNRKT